MTSLVQLFKKAPPEPPVNTNNYRTIILAGNLGVMLVKDNKSPSYHLDILSIPPSFWNRKPNVKPVV